MYLDKLSSLSTQVGYGRLGQNGALGYEDKPLVVKGNAYLHAFSAHAPSRLVFQLEGCYRQFTCDVALNDDVPAGVSHADFSVYADGRRVACESFVVAGESPRRLCSDITGAQTLELVVETTRWEYCHAVWLDPVVLEEAGAVQASTLMDPLRRVEVQLPSPMPSTQHCIATVISPGFEAWADNLLGSLMANGDCEDARLVLFAVNQSNECDRIARKYDALTITTRPLTRVDMKVKAVLYSVAQVVPAEKYLCLDADMLVLGSVAPIFQTLNVAPIGSILACREANYTGGYKLGDALLYTYFGRSNDLSKILGKVNGEAEYPLVVNDGLFAGTGPALRAMDGVIRAMPHAVNWIDEQGHARWRNQFIFNLALARLNCSVEVDDTFNVQLHTGEVDVHTENGGLQVLWRGRPVKIIHFCGIGKQKYPQLQRLYTG